MGTTDSQPPEHPYLVLAEALAALVRQAVKEALAEVTASTPGSANLVSVAEAAHRLGIGKTKLNELIASGELPSVVLGRRRLLRPVDLETYATQADTA